MSFVIDSDVCSAFLRGNNSVYNRFMQHSGGLYVSAVTLAELYTWVHLKPHSPKRPAMLRDLLTEVNITPVDEAVAERFGIVRADLLARGKVVATADMLIASTALLFDYTDVTHNTRHFAMVPGLRLEDWLTP